MKAARVRTQGGRREDEDGRTRTLLPSATPIGIPLRVIKRPRDLFPSSLAARGGSTVSPYIITIRVNRVRKDRSPPLRLIIPVPFRGNVSFVPPFRYDYFSPRRDVAPPPPPRSKVGSGESKRTTNRVGRTGFSPAVPSRKGLRHPGYTDVPPGCPRGCNEDKSLAYLINSQRSTARSSLPPPHLPLLSLLFLFAPVPTSSNFVDRIESEFLRPIRPV